MIQTRKYDLEERTAKFAEEVVNLCRTLKQDAISRPLITQIVRSSTSIGANYMEANGASSRKDFRNKIYLCKKEARETLYWLRMLSQNFPEKNSNLESLNREVKELILIFGKITSTLKNEN